MSFAHRLASDLLRIGAVSLRPGTPFQWSSGLHAPVYCDNRLTLAYPEVRTRIAAGFLSLAEEEGWEPDVIAGTATAGIPHAAWLADRAERPMAYVRAAKKEHGQQNRIEGRVEAQDEVIVVEDLISTGQSALEAAEALREAGANVLGVLAIFSYELPEAHQRFLEAQIPLRTLTNFSTLLDVVEKEEACTPDELSLLRDWQRDPVAWSRQHG